MPGIWNDSIFNVKDYGAVGDGVTDDTASIQSAMSDAQTAGGGIVFFPIGTYCISDELYVYQIPVSLVGVGSGWNAWLQNVATNISVLKWTGSSGKAMIHYKTVNTSFKIDSIKLDCNDSASVGMLLDGVQGGIIDNISILNKPADCGLRLTATEMTCSWNSFRNLGIQNLVKSNTKAIHLTGGEELVANTCHNTFINTRIDHGGSNSHAIYLGNCDNNGFYDVYVYRDTGGTGRGVYCDSTEQTNFPIANIFYHLQAGVGGWWQDGGTQYNIVNFYATDNGQPAPVPANGNLSYSLMNGCFHPTISINGMYGKPGNNLTVSTAITDGVSTYTDITFPLGPEPDGNYDVYFSCANDLGGRSIWASNKTASGFRINISSAIAYPIYISGLIVR